MKLNMTTALNKGGLQVRAAAVRQAQARLR